ncbi:MAG: hypothetical protein O9305_20230 [Rhodobacteraceae bacterium]|nr:hypothetical protein [Paracoccaceae bacterium]
MKITVLQIALASFVVFGSSVCAQFIAPESDNSSGSSEIEGFWVSVDMCDRQVFSEFFDIRKDGAVLTGTYWWFGAQTGTSKVDIIENDVGYVFDSRTRSVVDFDYRHEGGFLVEKGIDSDRVS